MLACGRGLLLTGVSTTGLAASKSLMISTFYSVHQHRNAFNDAAYSFNPAIIV